MYALVPIDSTSRSIWFYNIGRIYTCVQVDTEGVNTIDCKLLGVNGLGEFNFDLSSYKFIPLVILM